MLNLLVRTATAENAAGAVEVLRASITHLCVDDHLNDPETLRLWLHNKTEQGFKSWLQNPDVHIVVAEQQSRLLGVGAIDATGRIRLLYVHPDCQRVGIGAALLAALERQAESWRLAQVTLGSSIGACPFYERHGYTRSGPPEPGFGVSRCFPYEKHLA
jgi:GNAT superfamily N-acetyltransferase